MNASQVLDRAADYIETHELYRGTDPDTWVEGAACAAIAIGELSTDSAALRALLRALGAAAAPNAYWLSPIWRWNDASTKAEVIAMLRAVAATERAREAKLLPVVRESVNA